MFKGSYVIWSNYWASQGVPHCVVTIGGIEP